MFPGLRRSLVCLTCLMRVDVITLFPEVVTVPLGASIVGRAQERGALSLAELIAQLELPVARIAVELNREVVRRSDWSGTMLHEEDRIEIVHFVGGGRD